jgi:hypothetical protein
MYGFDDYDNSAQTLATAGGWVFGSVTNALIGMSTTSPAYGTVCLRAGTASASCYAQAPALLSGAAYGVGCFMVAESNNETSTAARTGVNFHSGSTRLLTVQGSFGGVIRAIGPTGTNYDSAGGVISAHTWFHIEIQFVVSATVGQIKVWVNGVLVINQTNINTGTTNASSVRFGAPLSSFDLYRWDSVIIYNCASGDAPIGEKQVITLRANADTATTDWTKTGAADAWDCINDDKADGDTAYISSSTLNDTTIVGLESMPANYTSIDSLMVSSYAKKLDAGTCSLTQSIVQGVNTADGAEKTLAVNYAFVGNDIFTTDPTSGVAFTASDINSLEVKLKRTA